MTVKLKNLSQLSLFISFFRVVKTRSKREKKIYCKYRLLRETHRRNIQEFKGNTLKEGIFSDLIRMLIEFFQADVCLLSLAALLLKESSF